MSEIKKKKNKLNKMGRLSAIKMKIKVLNLDFTTGNRLIVNERPRYNVTL